METVVGKVATEKLQPESVSSNLYNMKKAFLFLLILTGIIEGCKYDDGPVFSLISARHRVYGRYILEKFTINGIDSLQQMQNRYGLNFYFYYEDTNEVDDMEIFDSGGNFKFITRYSLTNHNKIIRMNYGSVLLTGSWVPNYQATGMTILKLTHDEIHMKTTFNDKEYLFELKE
ncbi:MAG: hypothetical protein HGB12_12905 [Bacteroidetes bacterium]|nr:hypothetical protein [Bacteroidota bacterium]